MELLVDKSIPNDYSKNISPNAKKMKKVLLVQTITLIFILAYNQTIAQTPTWQWAKSAGGSFDDIGQSIAVDASGNSYVTGYFSSLTITFGSFTLVNDTTDGGLDVFTVKYDPEGNVLWAESAGGSDYDKAFSVAVDNSGNSYITGYFYSTAITFGSFTLISSRTGGSDIFIVKYDPGGNVLWATSAGGSIGETGYGIAVDASGNSYITGIFDSPSIIFDSITLTNANSSGGDLFTVKYDPMGNVLWAVSAGGNGNDWGTDIVVDASGNSFITGFFSSSSITFGSSTLLNTGSDDILVVKYDTWGNVLWAASAGGSGYDNGNGIALDTIGNLFINGQFSSPSISFGLFTLINAGGYDGFIVKYDPGGNVLWAKSAGGNFSDVGSDIAADAGGNTFITGFFQSPSITFDSFTLTNDTTNASRDVFAVKYDPGGNVLWATSAGGSSGDIGCDIAVDVSGNSYITGAFGSLAITFGSSTLTNDSTDASGDVFTAKLGILTGKNENIGGYSMSFFPNPFSGQATLWTPEQLKNATLTVNNHLGQTVVQIKNISGQTVTLSRDNLASGLYFVHLVQGNKVIATTKVIITD